MVYLATIVMGVVEGLTEFLPISSTGHLILVGEWLHFDQMLGPDAARAFEIIIQLGAILAVLFVFPGRFVRLARLDEKHGFAGLRGLGLLAVTSIPAALLGLLAKKALEKHLFGSPTVALALAVGAVAILIVEWRRPRTRIEGLDALGWREALWIGLFQCCALWPGMSRSASTIVGGMLAGVDRRTAAEYSFFAAVPLMAAATGLKLIEILPQLNGAQAGIFALGFLVAFLSAWAAVKCFVHFLGRHTLVPFAWYRLALAGLVLWRLAGVDAPTAG